MWAPHYGAWTRSFSLLREERSQGIFTSVFKKRDRQGIKVIFPCLNVYMRMLEREQSVKKNYLETQKGTGNESKLHSNEPCLIQNLGLILFNQSIIYLISKSILQELFYQRCELFLLIGWLRFINSFRCCKKHSFWLWQ